MTRNRDDPELRRLRARIEERRGQGRRRRPGLRRAAGGDARVRGRVPGGRLRRHPGPDRRAARPVVPTSGTSPTPRSRPRSPRATSRRATPTDLAGFDIAVITVQTPLIEGSPDLSFIEAAGRQLALGTSRPVRSSCSSRPRIPAPPRSCCARSSKRAACVADVDFFLGYSPERIDPGNTTFTFVNTAKVVAGIGPDSLSAVEDFYGVPRRQDRARRVDG